MVNLRPNRNQNQIGDAGGVQGRAVGFGGRVNHHELRAVLAGGFDGWAETRSGRGHHGGVIGFTAIFPVRGVGLGVEVDDQRRQIGAGRFDGEAGAGRRLPAAAFLADHSDCKQVDTSTSGQGNKWRYLFVALLTLARASTQCKPARFAA